MNEQQVKVKRLSPHLAHTLLTLSPKHAWAKANYMLETEKDDNTKPKGLGKLVDRLVYGVGDEIVVRQPREKMEPVRGQIHCLQTELDRATKIAAAVMDKVPDVRLGELQRKLIWDYGEVVCAGIPDQVLPGGHVRDLKTCWDCSDDGIQKAIEDYGYDIAAAAYISGIVRLDNIPADFQWIFVESGYPHDVRIITPTAEMLQSGRRLWDKAVTAWKIGMDTGNWEGRGNATVDVSRKRKYKDNSEWFS